MKKAQAVEEDDMLPEYDFTKGRIEKGKFRDFGRQGSLLRAIDADLADKFKDSDAVNEALREYLRLKKESA